MTGVYTKRCLLHLTAAALLVQFFSVPWSNAGETLGTKSNKTEASDGKTICCNDLDSAQVESCNPSVAVSAGTPRQPHGTLSLAVSIKLAGNPLTDLVESFSFLSCNESTEADEHIAELIDGCCPKTEYLSFHLEGKPCSLCKHDQPSGSALSIAKNEDSQLPPGQFVSTHETFENYRASVEAAWAKSKTSAACQDAAEAINGLANGSPKSNLVFDSRVSLCDYSDDDQCPTGGHCPSNNARIKQATESDSNRGDGCYVANSCETANMFACENELTPERLTLEQICREIIVESHDELNSISEWPETMQRMPALPPAPGAGPLPQLTNEGAYSDYSDTSLAGAVSENYGQPSYVTPFDAPGSQVVFYETLSGSDQAENSVDDSFGGVSLEDIVLEHAAQAAQLELVEEFSDTREEYLEELFQNRLEAEIAHTQLEEKDTLSKVIVENATLSTKLSMLEEMAEMRIDLIQQVFEARLEAELANARAASFETQNTQLRKELSAHAAEPSAGVNSALDAKELVILRRQCQMLNQELAKSKLYVHQLQQQLANRQENVNTKRMPIPFAASAINVTGYPYAHGKEPNGFEEEIRGMIEKSLNNKCEETCETPAASSTKQ